MKKMIEFKKNPFANVQKAAREQVEAVKDVNKLDKCVGSIGHKSDADGLSNGELQLAARAAENSYTQVHDVLMQLGDRKEIDPKTIDKILDGANAHLQRLMPGNKGKKME